LVDELKTKNSSFAGSFADHRCRVEKQEALKNAEQLIRMSVG
jgi:hypothetical protein